MAFDLAMADRAKGLAHVHYEIEQFDQTVRYLKDLPANAPRGKRNPATEVWLLHTRILIEFFEASSRRSGWDDILAKDYDFQPSALPINSGDKDRINKEVAHLTYSRTTVEDKSWNVHLIAPAILRRALKFIEFLQQGKWKPEGTDATKWNNLRESVNATLNMLMVVRPGDVGATPIIGRTD